MPICIFLFFRMNVNLIDRKWAEFAYICCPLCDFRTKGKKEFEMHGLEEHYDWVIEQCDSIEYFGSSGLQGKILPKTKMQIRKEWLWAIGDDNKIDKESKVHIMFIL